MQEYIVSCRGYWWHFFYKASFGLCFRKKNGTRFSDFEILLKEAENDFCVYSDENNIFLVCQDHVGSVLSLVFNGDSWKKTVLLTGKDGKAAPKHFSLCAVGSYLHLYYVIVYKEKHMLIHQMLQTPSSAPTVVDYIFPSQSPYQVCRHSSGDLSVCYQNEQGLCGIRRFVWSQKTYQPFRRPIPSRFICAPALFAEENDVCHFAAVAESDTVKNLLYFRMEADGSFSELSTIYLDCPENALPVFFRKDNRLYLEWSENGCVMMSYLSEETEKWKKPVKYMRSSPSPISLFHICHHKTEHLCYGFSDTGSIRLYGMDKLIAEAPKPAVPPKYRPQGFEAEEFAKQFGYHPRTAKTAPEEKFVPAEEFQKKYEEIRKELKKQNDMLLALSRRISDSESTPKASEAPPLAEREEDIDSILLASLPSKQTSENRASQPKIVVTGK